MEKKGRPQGSKTEFSKAWFLEAFNDVGGKDALVRWVKASPKNREAYYQMVARILPKHTTIDMVARDRQELTHRQMVAMCIEFLTANGYTCMLRADVLPSEAKDV